MNRARPNSWVPLAGRLGVAVLLGLALWNPGWRSAGAPVDAVVVLDESRSMGELRPAAAWRTLAATLAGLPDGSRYSLVRFGAEPVLESAMRSTGGLAGMPARPQGTVLDATGTDIEAALRLALRQLDGHSPALMLLATDGGETSGDAAGLLARFRSQALPVPYLLLEAAESPGPDAAIEALDLPSRVTAGAEFEAVVRLSGTVDAAAELQVQGAAGPAISQPVELAPGRVTEATIPLVLEAPGFRELGIAVALPGDVNPVNDQRRVMVDVQGRSAIFHVADGLDSAVAQALRAGGWNVESMRPEHFPQVLPQLPSPAVVILDDVAVGDMAGPGWSVLTESVRARGTGLIVLGGQRSFGAGAYLGSTLETALPVTSEAGAPMSRAAALFVVDKSGSMGRGNGGVTPFATARTAVLAAARLLGERDQVGLIAFDVAPDTWLPLAERDEDLSGIQSAWRGGPSGGTRLAPALAAAAGQLAGAGVDQRLLILVTDGFAADEDYAGVLADIDASKITVIAMAIGDAPRMDVLERLTAGNDGRLLRVADVIALPRLMSAAVGARRLTFDARVTLPRRVRTLPFFDDGGVSWPALRGYLVTRERPNARVYLRSERGDPLLADHDFGLGRAVVLPGGLGRDASAWPGWPGWAPFLGGLVEWAGQRLGDDRVHLALDEADVHPRLEIDALTAGGDWQIADAARVSLGDPFGRITVLDAAAVAPGKFAVELPLRHTGRHRVSVNLGSVSRRHEFFHNAPAELGANARATRNIADWLDRGLVEPWPAGDARPIRAAASDRPTRPWFVLLGALLYLATLLAKHAHRLRQWRSPWSALRS